MYGICLHVLVLIKTPSGGALPIGKSCHPSYFASLAQNCTRHHHTFSFTWRLHKRRCKARGTHVELSTHRPPQGSPKFGVAGVLTGLKLFQRELFETPGTRLEV